MNTTEARERIRETITAIRKVFTNKAWCAWADAWLAGKDQTSKSAMAMAQAMALLPRTVIKRDRRNSRQVLLAAPAGNVAAAARFVEDLVRARHKGPLPEWLNLWVTEGYKE